PATLADACIALHPSSWSPSPLAAAVAAPWIHPRRPPSIPRPSSSPLATVARCHGSTPVSAARCQPSTRSPPLPPSPSSPLLIPLLAPGPLLRDETPTMASRPPAPDEPGDLRICTPALPSVPQALRSLYNGYASEMGESSNYSSQRSENGTSVKSHSWSDWSNHMSAQRNQFTGELDRYLHDDLFPCDDEDFDILYWWRMHASQYPIVSRMARDVLAAPASTVASESAFSTSGRIINDHRTRLSGNTIEALICFQDWLREAGSSYLDIINISSLNSVIEDLGGAGASNYP
ncbi:unnamed protein product, partial [Urochloa humidicola]